MGTQLEVRLAVSTGSGISHRGDPIHAVLIAPVFGNGELLLPQGSTVSGVVNRVERLGLGLKHFNARIGYQFDSVQVPNGVTIPLQTSLVSVEEAKERVSPEGLVGGINPAASISSTASFYILPLLCLDPAFGLPILGVKFLIARSPDPEIFFPAGTEMMLRLKSPVDVADTAPPLNRIPVLSETEQAEALQQINQLPQQRTNRGRDHPSDLINLLFLGSRDAISRAFHAAGWSGAQPRSLVSIYRMYHCMVQRSGYSAAPMGRLTFNGETADADFQKSLDTFSKRHHIRLWQQEGTGTWFGAATEDVNYKLRRAHLTHATDARIDDERNKVLNDLAFTGCLDSAGLVGRDLSATSEPQDSSISTDGNVVVIRMNDCGEPREMPGVAAAESNARARPRGIQIAAAIRNDMLRSNPVSLGLNISKLIAANQSPKVIPVEPTLKTTRTTPQHHTELAGAIRPTFLQPAAH